MGLIFVTSSGDDLSAATSVQDSEVSPDGEDRAFVAALVVGGATVGAHSVHWWGELRVLPGAATDDPIILAAASIQAQLAAAVGWLGVGGLAAVVAGLVGVTLLISRLRAGTSP